MGSTPSYQVQNHPIKTNGIRSRRPSENGKESIRSSRNKQKQPQKEVNPEQENEILSNEPEQQSTHFHKEFRSQKDPNQILTNALQRTHQQIPIAIPVKKASTAREAHKQADLEAQNPQQQEAIPEKQMQQRGSNRPKLTKSLLIEEEPLESHEKPKGRHYFKASTHQPVEEPIINSSSVVGKKPYRRSEEIDYKEYDSAHIRHKAMQEVGQHEHHAKPIIAREPVYQHERLYPKILKNSNHEIAKEAHHEHTPNRHYEHERNVEEEAYEQPHKLHLYKRHILQHHAQGHEEQALQKSMEVRAHLQEDYDIRGNYNPNPRPKVSSIDSEGKRPEVKSFAQEEEQHAQPNFRKRKGSIPTQMPQDPEKIKRGRNILQELEEKSIADINKEREFNITEYEVNPADLVTCREGCGRKFQVDRISKHESVCREAHQKHREAFNTKNHRIISKQQLKLLKRGAKLEVHPHRNHKEVPKWKAQSIALRAHIKMGMDSQYRPNNEEMEMLSQEHHIDIVTCPFCERKFNKNSGKTHIPFCKAQLEKQLERERFQKPKTKR